MTMGLIILGMIVVGSGIAIYQENLRQLNKENLFQLLARKFQWRKQ